jgi:hypothetical protein
MRGCDADIVAMKKCYRGETRFTASSAVSYSVEC